MNTILDFTIKTSPTDEPVSVEFLKTHARIDGNREDDLLRAYLQAAREGAELYTNRAFITQTLVAFLNQWPCSETIYLPRPPFQSVVQIRTLDESNDATEYSSDYYYTPSIVGGDGTVTIKTGSTPPATTERTFHGIEIEFTVGYGDTSDDVPGMIRLAITSWAKEAYENRGKMEEIFSEPPDKIKPFLDPFRVNYL